MAVRTASIQRDTLETQISVKLDLDGSGQGIFQTGLPFLEHMLAQVARHGLITANKRRLMCLSMFWHFLDVVWIGVFTFVYLMGSLP